MSKDKKQQASNKTKYQKKWWENLFPNLLLLIILTTIAYWPTFKNGWTNWDDNGYVLDNELVKQTNLSNWTEHFKQSSVMGNYHPLAMLSLGIDYANFSNNAPAFHRTSFFLHLFNTLLLFFILLQLFNSTIWSTLGALLFSIHPMHVESVAWISERKDVLYVCFYFLAVLAFIQFNKLTSVKWIWYAITLLMFILSNLSKAQAVTLPVVLFLMDYMLSKKNLKNNVLDKLPFIILSIFFGLLAIKAQRESEAINFIPFYTWLDRILFASYALFSYIYKFIFPIQLAAFHPYPLKTADNYPVLYYVAPVALILISVLSGYIFFRNRLVHFGIGVFLINVILILQLLPVGNAIFAERYTYLAYTGLIILVIGLMKYLKEIKKVNAQLLFICLAGIVLVFSYQTYSRVQIWNNSASLWTDVISTYNYAPNAHNNLGSYYQKNEMLDSAMLHFNIALSLQKDFPEALINRSDIFRVRGSLDSAIADCNRAIRVRPQDEGGYMNRGIALSIQGKYDEALKDFNQVLSMNDNNIKAHSNRANLLALRGEYEASLSDYARVIELDPNYTEAYANRARTYMTMKKYNEALTDINRAIILNPNNADAYLVSADINYNLGNYNQALEAATRAHTLGKPVSDEFIQQLKARISQVSSPD